MLIDYICLGAKVSFSLNLLLEVLTKFRKVQVLVLSASLVFMLWVVFLLLPLLLNKSDDQLLHHTPEDAYAVVSVNNRKIIERFLFDALYAKGFTVNELEQLDYNQSDIEMPSSGIDLRENIVVFQTDYEKATVTGFIFKLLNHKAFSEYELRGNQEVKYFNEDIGCILLLPEELKDENDVLHFEQYAQNVVTTKRKHLPSENLSGGDNNRLVNLFYRGHDQTYIQDLELSARIKGSTIYFEGKGKKNDKISYESGTYTQIKSPGIEPYLEIRAGQLPDSVYSYFDVITEKFHIKIPPVTSQQLFFYGFKIDNINGSTAFLPKFDGVFRFADSVDLRTAVDSLCAAEHKIKRENERCVTVGEMHYHFKQQSPFEVVAGITENPELEKINQAPLPLLKGNPAATINFEGDGIIAQIAQMLPPVKYSRKLFNDLEYFEIHTENGENNTLKIKGQMRFPSDQRASLELFKYLMKF